METQKFGNLETQKLGNLKSWKSVNLETLKHINIETQKLRYKETLGTWEHGDLRNLETLNL